MVGKDRALAACEVALRECEGDQAEVLILTNDEGFTRYANSEVTQHSVETNARVTVKVIRGRKIGCATGNSLASDSMRRVAKQASANARASQDDPELTALPGPRPLTPVQSYCESTANSGPGYRADNVAKVIRVAGKLGFQAAGVCTTHVTETAVANSIGVRAYQATTWVDLTCVVMSGEGSGYADAVVMDADRLDAAQVAGEASMRCSLNRDQLALEPGEYSVILEPYAAGYLIDHLASGFRARAYQEGRSFLRSIGQKIVSENLTVWDDGPDPLGIPSSFDYEGQPKSKVVLVDKGVSAGLLYDSVSAAKEGKESTGHYGTTNLLAGEGPVSRDDLIAGTERAILVTRFHYVRPVHPQRTIITGMTRDGTFLVEHGAISRAVMNMRFTESVLEALASADLSKERRLVGSLVVPAMRLARFSFTARAGH